MGDSVDNISDCHHKMKGAATEHWLRRHLGSADIDTSSPLFGTYAWRVLRDAALSGTDAQMDAAGVAACGTWYTTHISGVAGNRACLRASIADTCGTG